MKPYAIKKYLASDRTPVLPPCAFERTIRCSECVYFEPHNPDSKGQCRCAYRGRWYYPHEGCTDGMGIPQPLYGPPPVHDPDPSEKKRRRAPSLALIVLMILIAALLVVISVRTSFHPIIPCLLIAAVLLMALRSFF